MMKQIFSKLLFKLKGWKIIGTHTYPDKCLVVSAPHTSNWDFFIGRCYAYIIGVNPRYLAKSELFLPVLRILIKWNGGIPVYRNAKNNVVDHVVEMFNTSTKLNLGIAPEGTRTWVEKWKTGFYHIAVKAKVPILLLKMDYQKKEVGIMCEFMPSGDFEKDMLFIQEKYKDVKGKIPENYNPNII
jgi:1-acyl-sn-glycerol-3-phosphate acyltransferase